MACVKLKNINKIYPNGNQAVYDFNLDIEDKEFILKNKINEDVFICFYLKNKLNIILKI